MISGQGTLLMDRVEKLTIRKLTSGGTVVKLVVTERGVTADYSIKTFEHGIPEAIQNARKGCNRYLRLANDSYLRPA